MDSASDEKVAQKFEAAWQVFAETCCERLVNEATYQVWFAHFLISQFGIHRVLREPDFGPRHFTTDHAPAFNAYDSLRVDVVVSRDPAIGLPHRAILPRGEHDGIARLGDLAVISELKVSATQAEGLSYAKVARDYQKLSLLLDEAEAQQLPLRPLAYVCVLDNGKGKSQNRRTPTFNWAHLYDHHLSRIYPDGVDKRITVLGRHADVGG